MEKYTEGIRKYIYENWGVGSELSAERMEDKMAGLVGIYFTVYINYSIEVQGEATIPVSEELLKEHGIQVIHDAIDAACNILREKDFKLFNKRQKEEKKKNGLCYRDNM